MRFRNYICGHNTHEPLSRLLIPTTDSATSFLFLDIRVRREGAEAIHFVPALSLPFEIGSEVQLVVDWERRFDHMTQHSGQHLITAVADKSLGAPTTSWNLGKNLPAFNHGRDDINRCRIGGGVLMTTNGMSTEWIQIVGLSLRNVKNQTGEKISTIELDTPSLSADQMQQLENEVNEKIRAGLPVYPTLYPSKEALETKVGGRGRRDSRTTQ